MKQTILLVAMLAAAMASGCSRPQAAADGRKHILCSTFPMYLFTANIARDVKDVDVQLMIPAAMGCPHDYSLTPDDLRKIAAADILVVNGLGMEEFLGKPVAAANPRIQVIEPAQGLANLLEFTPEEGGGQEEHGEHHHSKYNPHLFASPQTAAVVVLNLAGRLGKADATNVHAYMYNAKRYAEELYKIGEELRAAVHAPPAPRIVTEHAVFDYLARDAGMEIVAVVEEDPGQAPSAAEMMRIIARIKESKAAALFTEPQYPAAVGKTIAGEAGIPVATLDPVANGPSDAPLDYYQQVMRQNARVLAQALGAAKNATQPATLGVGGRGALHNSGRYSRSPFGAVVSARPASNSVERIPDSVTFRDCENGHDGILARRAKRILAGGERSAAPGNAVLRIAAPTGAAGKNLASLHGHHSCRPPRWGGEDDGTPIRGLRFACPRLNADRPFGPEMHTRSPYAHFPAATIVAALGSSDGGIL